MGEKLEIVKESAPGRTVRIHTCSICGIEDEWSESWSWWGSIEDWDLGRPVIKCCSDKCRAVLEGIQK